MRFIQAISIFFGFLLWITPAFSEPPTGLRHHFTLEEFKVLAVELAPKVTLFADAWAQDPDAEFYGGTTRDYLYWLYSKFDGVNSREDAERVANFLRGQPVIDVRSFIIGDSDVDIVSDEHLDLEAKRYAVKKIDSIDAERFDPMTQAGQDELNQGYIPVEKIRLSRKGFVKWKGVGDGIREIFEGPVTVHFSPRAQFQSTQFAQKGLNHPILLALRYLRLAAIDYFRRHGADFPTEALFKNLDPESAAQVRKIIRKAVETGELKPYFEQTKFGEWLNATIRKGFVSHTNPTAAKILFDDFGVPDLIARYPEMEKYNQFLFARQDDPTAIASHLADYKVESAEFYQPVSKAVPEARLFHGTREDRDFRAILFQNVLPSEAGTAGGGLYAVPRSDIEFAATWGGSEDRIVEFKVRPAAKIVDLTQGEGRRVFEAFKAKYSGPAEHLEDAFATHFGVDILRYQYQLTDRAFVVKNSAAIASPQGYRVRLLPLPDLLEEAGKVHSVTELDEFLRTVRLNHVSSGEIRLLLLEIKKHSRSGPIRTAAAYGLSTWKEEGARPALRGEIPILDRFLPLLIECGDDDYVLGKLLPHASRSERVYEKLAHDHPLVVAEKLLPLAEKEGEANLQRVWEELGPGKIRVLQAQKEKGYEEERALPWLTLAIKERDVDTRKAAAEILSEVAKGGLNSGRTSFSAAENLAWKLMTHDLLDDPAPAVRVAVLSALTSVPSAVYLRPDFLREIFPQKVLPLFHDPDPVVRRNAADLGRDFFSFPLQRPAEEAIRLRVFPDQQVTNLEMISDPSPAVRIEALRAYWFYQLYNPNAKMTPVALFATTKAILMETLKGAGESKDLFAADNLVTELHMNQDPWVRRMIGELGNEMVTALAQDEFRVDWVRKRAFQLANRTQSGPAIEAIQKKLMDDPHEEIRIEAIRGYLRGRIQTEALAPYYRKLVDGLKSDGRSLSTTISALGEIKPEHPSFIEVLANIVETSVDQEFRANAMNSLSTGAWGNEEVANRLLPWLRDSNQQVSSDLKRWHVWTNTKHAPEAMDALLDEILTSIRALKTGEKYSLDGRTGVAFQTLEVAITYDKFKRWNQELLSKLAVLLSRPEFFNRSASLDAEKIHKLIDKKLKRAPDPLLSAAVKASREGEKSSAALVEACTALLGRALPVPAAATSGH